MHEYKNLKNPPLKFALAEFRFSSVMQIADYIPKIQEELRKKYPIVEKGNDEQLQVETGNLSVENVYKWRFLSTNKKSSVDITHERLVYITEDYSGFDGFTSACEQVIATLEKTVEPSLILRIGLRYDNLILIDGGDTAHDLVSQNFTFMQDMEKIGIAQHQTTETFFRTSVGGMTIRSLYGENNLCCLPDVQRLSSPLKDNLPPSERIIIDFDHFWEAKEEPLKFKSDTILNKLNELHETSRWAFWELTTDYARRQKWE